MVLTNSQVDTLVDLFESLLLDITETSEVVLTRDMITIRHRVKHEGIAFLTKSLPRLGKHLDRCLENELLSVPDRFAPVRGTTRPKFLGGLFSLVFEDDGRLRAQADASAIAAIRQICFLVYKLEIPYTDSQEEGVLARFVATDRELSLGDDEALFESASHIIENVLKEFDPFNIIPHHGPGAVATGERGEEKWNFSRIYSRVDRYFPFERYYMLGGEVEIEDRRDWHNALQRVKDPVAKVVLVPKDSRGPRLISCEPLEIQWIQQGIMRELVPYLERHPLTSGQVNFTDQSINQRLAYRASIDKRYATIDLNDASDRVSLSLVEWLYKRVPDFLTAIMNTRSTATRLPSGQVITLSKFAPMGSALCFPVEALCFWALSVASVIRAYRLPLRKVARQIYVYGDDIIAPSAWLDVITNALTQAGLKVNLDKTFVRGNFRESCGVDAFKGVNVTPTRIRKLPSGKRSDGAMISNYIAVAHAFEHKRYHRSAEHLYRYIETLIGPIPYGTTDAGYIRRLSPTSFLAYRRSADRVQTRWNAALQRIEGKVPVVTATPHDIALDGWNRLLRNLTHGAGDSPSKAVSRRSAKLKRRWRALV